MGKVIGLKLETETDGLDNGEYLNRSEDIAAVLSAACLAHDIGNPPFGHAGEAAIQAYFLDRGERYLKDLSDPQRRDLLNYEGNALGFRILTRSNPALTSVDGGYALTHATLGAFMKYPRSSVAFDDAHKFASERKFGLFDDDVKTYSGIAARLGIPRKPLGDRWYRHPLAFLMEAADDICYRIVDFEDGYKLGRVDFRTACRLLKEIAEGLEGHRLDGLTRIKSNDEKIGYLRAKAINSLVHQAADVFSENVGAILSGRFDTSLGDLILSKPCVDKVARITKERIYCCQAVVRVEAAGHEVIGGLLEVFLRAAIDSPKAHSSRALRSLIPERFLVTKGRRPPPSPYPTIMPICEFIAGMTDTYAIDTFRTIKGISLPNY